LQARGAWLGKTCASNASTLDGRRQTRQPILDWQSALPFLMGTHRLVAAQFLVHGVHYTKKKILRSQAPENLDESSHLSQK
jgi:hypothetical protein